MSPTHDERDATRLPEEWSQFLAARFGPFDGNALESFLESERSNHDVLPARFDVYRAFLLTPPASVNVVILGQDPYPTPGYAHGLAFSVRPNVRIPASLRNLFRERRDDLGIPPATIGNLTAWAERGVLLLNRVLTVRAGDAGSHRNRGWETLTERVISAISQGSRRVVFILWGNDAQNVRPHIDATQHIILESAHPSPLSARRGFFGSKPFSRANAALVEFGREPIDWQLPDDGK